MSKYYFPAFLVLLLSWGCAAPPTMQAVDQASADTGVVFGSVEVYEDGELQKWGTRFFGADYFYLMVLPPDSNEAITAKLAKDGNFFWLLKPGEYTLLGYLWETDSWQRSGRIGATFSVPEPGVEAYIGTIVFRGNQVILVPSIEDRFAEIGAIFDARFPDRKGTSVKQLLEEPQPIGNFAAYRGRCHEAWNVDCSKQFQGVTPIAPDVSTSGFPLADTLTPEFRWKGCPRSDVSYDLILYEAAAYTYGGRMVPSYTRGHMVAYAEDLKEPRWQPETPLKPDTRYIWSVRLRDGDTISGWSTQSHSTFLLVYMSAGYGQWFQFKTA